MEIKSEISKLTSNFLFKNYDIKVEKIEIQNTKKDFDGDITIVLFPFFTYWSSGIGGMLRLLFLNFK